MKTNPIRSFILNLVGAVALTAMTTGAVVIYPKQQDRSVQASLDFGGLPYATNASASGFGPFTNNVSFGGGGRYEPYWVTATQDSQIGTSNITASGSTSVGLGNAFAANANAQSDFKVKFRLLQPVTFSLAGQLIWNEIGTLVVQSPWVRLSGASGIIFQSDAAPLDSTPLDYSTNATLLPGEYVLEAHAGVTNDFANGADKSFTLNFSVTPTGPAIAGFGNVYQLFGGLNCETLNNGMLMPRLVLPNDLVNIGLGLSSSNSPVNQLLALVSDSLDHSLRLAVWDKKTAAIVAELGGLDIQSSLVTSNSYAAIADWTAPGGGRFVDSFGGVNNRVSFSPKGTFDAQGTVNQFKAISAVGQLNVISNPGGTTNTILVRNGVLVTVSKLGMTP